MGAKVKSHHKQFIKLEKPRASQIVQPYENEETSFNEDL